MAGVDLRTPEPVERAIAYFSARVDELEQLTGHYSSGTPVSLGSAKLPI